MIKLLEKVINRLIPRATLESNKKLAAVQHELDYTMKSKNILTLNNHAKDDRLAKLEAYTAYLLKHKVFDYRVAQKTEDYENKLRGQKELLLELEYEIEGLKLALNLANIENSKRWWKSHINFMCGK